MNFGTSNKKCILLILLAATSSSLAFAPPKPPTPRFVQTSKQGGAVVLRTIGSNNNNVNNIIAQDISNSALLMSDNSADQMKEQLNELQEKADEATKFLVVDVNRAQGELAENWGWILASGVLTIALGALAFGMPIFATGVAYDATVLTIAITAVVNLINAFKVEQGQKLKYGLSSPLYGLLAYYMSTHPAEGLTIITLTIATVIGAEGIFETALALKNKDIQGRPWLFASGIGSVLASVWLSFNIPVSSLFAPGAAIGTRLTSSGATKVATGLVGKEIADTRKE